MNCFTCQGILIKCKCLESDGEYTNIVYTDDYHYCISTHDYDSHEIEDEIIYDDNDPDEFTIKQKYVDIENEIWYYCGGCKTYFLACGKCSRLGKDIIFCYFLGSDGYDNCGKEIKRGTHPNIQYYVGDLKLIGLNTLLICPTGPDGGMNHYWQCPRCKFEFSITDK